MWRDIKALLHTILQGLLPYEKCQNIVPIRQLVCELHINSTIKRTVVLLSYYA